MSDIRRPQPRAPHTVAPLVGPHGAEGRKRPIAGQRYTRKGKAKQERENEIQTRIAKALRRHRFKVEVLSNIGEHGIRTNGLNLAASCGPWRMAFAVVLPGRTPDMRQRADLAQWQATGRAAFPVASVDEALRLISLGLLCSATPAKRRKRSG